MPQRITGIEQALLTFAQELDALRTQVTTQAASASQTATDFAALRNSLDQTPAHGYSQRPLATGAAQDEVATDC